MLNLLKLVPQIQDYLSGLTDESLLRFFTERRLRKITSEKDPETQLEKFYELKIKGT